MREWLVEQVRDQIHNGSYDEDEKLDALLERLAADLGVVVEDEQSVEAR